MSGFKYSPDKDIEIHAEGTIRLLCSSFQSHENGLPEWLKNSADAYARDDAAEEKRTIIILMSQGRKGVTDAIACLDFCGMTSANIEEDFRIWGDPEAARRGINMDGIQGGHGNGGKCYMVQMFDEFAHLHTVKEGRGCRYGVASGSFRFGYIPNRKEGKAFPARDIKSELIKVLLQMGCTYQTVARVAPISVKTATGFTLVRGVGPKGPAKEITSRRIASQMQEHHQMMSTLEMCRVFLIHNGRLCNRGKPLCLADIPPMPGVELREISIPRYLLCEDTDEKLSTTQEGELAPGVLTLRTSNKRMRWSKKGRHGFVLRAQSGYIGFIPSLELDVQSPYIDRIYGECQLDALEPFKRNDRSRLADSPLTRALHGFISRNVERLAEEFERRDRKEYNKEARNAVSRINEALDRWKNRILKELVQGAWGGAGERDIEPPIPLRPGRPSRIEVSLTHKLAGVGVAFRPRIRFFDCEGERIAPVPFRWVSDDNNVAMVNDELSVVNTFSPGRTSIYAQTINDSLKSNRVQLEVLRIVKIRIDPVEVELSVGGRRKLDAVCKLKDGREVRGVCLVWMAANNEIAGVSSAGSVFGFAPGETSISAGDDSCMSENPALVRVTLGGTKGDGDKAGGGFPRILVSGFQVDPDTNEHVTFSPEDPPVWQRALDSQRNIWWINSSAPMAKMYLNKQADYGYESREWRMYHLERVIDIIVHIALDQEARHGEQIGASEWMTRRGGKVAEIQSLAVADLSAFIAEGQLPEA